MQRYTAWLHYPLIINETIKHFPVPRHERFRHEGKFRFVRENDSSTSFLLYDIVKQR